MNATRRGSPSISPDEVDRLLFHLEDARKYIVQYGAAQSLHSPLHETASRTQSAIDDLVEQITGRRER